MSDLPQLTRLLFALPYIDLPLRKVLLTICRVQVFPHHQSYIATKFRVEMRIPIELDADGIPHEERGRFRASHITSIEELIIGLEHHFESPVFTGFLSSVVRSAPIICQATFTDAKVQGIVKEILAAIMVYEPILLDFRCIFSHSPADRNLPFASNLPSCPSVATAIHSAVLQLRVSMQNRILYPKTSRKRVGEVVERHYFKQAPPDFVADHWEMTDSTGVSTLILQRLEFWRGIKIKGPVEMRSAWKYNDLKPRVYYAQGGDTFDDSKYVQDLFNTFADLLDIVHTKNRYSPPQEILTKDLIAIIYDYISFTSKIQAVVRFLRELSMFLQGVNVVLVGEWGGPKNADLGDVLMAYNETCNSWAEFDISKVCSLEDTTLLRHSCGMLGVPGNIMAATILHGIHTAFIAESMTRSKCIGDDAKIYMQLQSPVDWIIFEDQLRNIGDISLEKTMSFEYTERDDFDILGWHYAKRPIMRTYNRIIQLPMTTFPTLDCILGLKDENRTILPNSTTMSARRHRFGNVWLRLLRSLHSEMECTEEDTELLYSYQILARKNLELVGRRPGRFQDKHGVGIAPPMPQKEEFGMDPLDLIASQYEFEEEIEVPKEAVETVVPYGYLGEQFESGSTKMLSFLEKMGILQTEVVFERVSRKSLGDKGFAARVVSQYRFSYLYTVLLPIPRSMYCLM